MAARKSITWPIVSIVVGLFVVFVALPDSAKGWAPPFLRSATFHLGLDLAGGTQLDFRISEREMEEQIASIQKQIEDAKIAGAPTEEVTALQLELQSIQDQKANIVEAIRNVLERRINALGVSEATITPSYIGDEKHLLVECPGVVDTQECIDTVGKTINLEFKEEFTEATDEYEQSVRDRVATALRLVQESGATLEILGQDLGSEIGVAYQPDVRIFEDQIPDGLSNLWGVGPSDRIYQREGTVIAMDQGPDGTPIEKEIPGIFLAQVVGPLTQTGRTVNEAPTAFGILDEEDTDVTYVSHEDETNLNDVDAVVASTLRGMQQGDLQVATLPDGSARLLFLRQLQLGTQEMEGSHILVSYAGADQAEASITRSKEEALARARDLKQQLDQGADFATLARAESDGPSAANGGSLGRFDKGTMVPAFSGVAFSLAEGTVSDPVETQFGYHIIKSDVAPQSTGDIARFEELIIEGDDATTKANALLNRLQRGDVQSIEQQAHWRTLFFSLLPSGWKDTLLDGKHFRSATVTLDPGTQFPIVQISFDTEGAKMFQELTKANVNKRIAIFVGGELVSAPTVQQEIAGGTAVITGSANFEEAKILAQDLNTGAIPAPIYLAGQHTVEATLGADALRTSLQAALLGIIALMVYMLLFYRLLGVVANVALGAYALLFVALLKLPLFLFSSSYIVLTLAGMAGIILSIGMAVDANVLIFERIKEELRKGKTLKTAIDTGFQRAWPSIRDGNASTIITCAILFMVGTSIVRGFAITLATGVLLSMFTAIVITRWIVHRIANTSLAEKKGLFGV